MRRKDEFKAQKIRNSVLKLTRLYGLQGISMSKIAKDCKLSSSTIYTYYENKDRMILDIYHYLRKKRHEEAHRLVTPSMKAKEALYSIFTNYYHYLITHEHEYYFIKQLSGSSSLSGELKNRDYNLSTHELLKHFIQTNELLPIDTTIIHSLLSAPLEKIAENYFSQIKQFSDEDIQQVFELIWKGIKA